MLTQLLVYKTRVCAILLLCSGFALLSLYETQNYYGNNSEIYATPEDYIFFNDSDYLVSSSKCKIPNLPPFNRDAVRFHRPQKYTSCSKHKLLSYVTKNSDFSDNNATGDGNRTTSYLLHIDAKIAPSYTKRGVSCCYSIVTRQFSKTSPDDGINISKCVPIQGNSVEIQHHNFVTVKCRDKVNNNTVYENTHATITITPEVHSKLEQFTNESKTTTDNRRPISVLIVSIDSVSRLNFIRSMPKTHAFLRDNNWVGLQGYNKIGDNTFPNVMAILAGYNESTAYRKCNPRKLGQLDKCPLLLYDFRKLGYVTAYAEDESWINTFNYMKKGFTEAPTDYYFRPYIIASEKLKMTRKDGMNYCTGPETAGERVLNIALDFVDTFKSDPHFGIFWMNTFSHNEINSPSGMDDKVLRFVENITRISDNTVIFLISDHGIRFGEIRYTETGWLEERLPFIFISVPEIFKRKFQLEYQNLQRNVHKFTNTFDMHMTLQHILRLSGYNRTVIPSESCPECRSLFQHIDSERSCEDSGIEQHWCACAGFTDIDITSLSTDDISHKISVFILAQIQMIIDRKTDSSKKCAKFSLHRILSARVSQKLGYKNDTYYLLVIETQPKAVFEATILHKYDDEFSLTGGISRLDQYGTHSRCINDSYLKMYCYCQN